MNRLVLSVLVIISSVMTSIAQEIKDFMRYEYSLTYKPYDVKVMPDSLAITEKFYLDVEGSNSMFCSEKLYKKFVSFIKKEIVEPQKQEIPWFVARNGKNMIHYEVVGLYDSYRVVQPLNLIKWAISSETDDYHGMKVQKATGELSGRTWTVWFTTEIPIIEGPYKFKNLPGFVVKASDANQDYVFEFSESKKVKDYWINLEMINSGSSEVTDKQLKHIKALNAKKDLKQVFAEMGETLNNNGAEDKAYLNKKFGKEPNPIELY